MNKGIEGNYFYIVYRRYECGICIRKDVANNARHLHICWR